ncbi:MAG: YqaJ viral recombinase family protein, partial [Robiginitomaculum sp.]|nr:YqaJ viral recombinase family protein [Robiginitomaculum sp.]
ARAMYELERSVDVEEVAFIEMDDYVGVSPDGLIRDDGMLEIKAPNTTTQLRRALSGNYAAEYKDQIQAQLWVAERDWCDFLSFDPRLDCRASFLIERVYRDDAYIKDMESRVYKFVEKMKMAIDDILMIE